jgi:glycosyltransferase involved in cell wall biosynthesis
VEAKFHSRYHLKRALRHGVALTVIARHCRSKGKRSVYLTCPGGYALWYIIALAICARALGYVTVVHHHSFAHQSRVSVAMRTLVRVVGNRGKHVLLCPSMRERFEELYQPLGASSVCSNVSWVTLTDLESDRQQNVGHPFRIGHLGSLSRAKGLQELPGLVTALVGDGIDAELWLAGAAPTRADQLALDAALAVLGPSRAQWLGVLDGVRKADFFQSIDVFVMPTLYRHEAQPLVVFEALRSGVPVVAYDVGCIADQLRTCGLVVSRSARFAPHALPFLTALARSSEALAAASRSAEQGFAMAKVEGARQSESLLRDLADSTSG